jgi:hypothetical protein
MHRAKVKIAFGGYIRNIRRYPSFFAQFPDLRGRDWVVDGAEDEAGHWRWGGLGGGGASTAGGIGTEIARLKGTIYVGDLVLVDAVLDFGV